METKPKAMIKYVGYQVYIGSCFRTCKTLEKAQEVAKEWEAEEVMAWEKRNSEETKLREHQEKVYLRLSYLIDDLDGRKRNMTPELQELKSKLQTIMKRVD